MLVSPPPSCDGLGSSTFHVVPLSSLFQSFEELGRPVGALTYTCPLWSTPMEGSLALAEEGMGIALNASALEGAPTLAPGVAGPGVAHPARRRATPARAIRRMSGTFLAPHLTLPAMPPQRAASRAVQLSFQTCTPSSA